MAPAYQELDTTLWRPAQATVGHRCVSDKFLTIRLLADRLTLYFDKFKIEKYQVNIAVALFGTWFGMCNAIHKD